MWVDDEAAGGFRVHSHSEDPFTLCRDYVAERLGLPNDYWRRGNASCTRPKFQQRDPRSDDGDQWRIDRALDIWRGSQDAAGTIVDRYLASRGLALPDNAADVLRFHPQCPWGDKATGRNIRVPAMIAAMRQIQGNAITAVHRTRLTPGGIKVDRMMLGRAAGSVVKIDPDDAVTLSINIGEGIETCLAARAMGFSPAWATGSAGGIRAFPILSGVDVMTIFAENDPTNAAATHACRDRWLRADRDVDVVHSLFGKDLNDALKAWDGHA